MSEEDAAGGKTRRFLGWLLISVGGLMLALSGLCTVTYSLAELTAPSHLANGAVEIFSGPKMLILVVPVGLPPIAAGVALLLWGRRVLGRS